jgi:hypothetical protein
MDRNGMKISLPGTISVLGWKGDWAIINDFRNPFPSFLYKCLQEMPNRQGLFKATVTLGEARVPYQLLLFNQSSWFPYAFGSASITDAMMIAQTVPSPLSNRPE